MRRAAPMLAGLAGVGVVGPLVAGIGTPSLLMLVPVFGAFGVAALAASQWGVVADRGWSAPGARTDAGLANGRAGSGGQRRPAPRAVAVALARVEGRELAGSPWFGVGVGFLAVVFLMFAVIYSADNGSHWADIVALAPWLVHPWVGMLVVAGHRGLTRARRDGADELFETCPVGPTTRTVGSLAAAWVPLLVFLAFSAVFGVTVAARSPNLYGSPGADAVAVVLAALLLVVGGVVLGVALGRWAPFALAPVVAVVAVGIVSLKLATVGDPGWNPLQQLATFPPLPSEPPIFTDPLAWSHLAWVAALGAAVLVAAIARHHRDRTVAVVGATACLLVAATGVTATRPMPGPSADRIADLVAHPADHQTCRAAGSVEVCAYSGHEELLSRVVAEVTQLAAALPGATAPVTLRQRFPGTMGDLPPEVARRLPGGIPAASPGELELGYDSNRSELRVPRFHVALRALGLPTEPDPDKRPVVIAGQARGVVALWLATRGLGTGPARELTSGRTSRNGDRSGPADAFDRGYVWPAGCGTAPVVWSAQDLRAARTLVALPEMAVRDVVHQGWERWRDPRTGTDELLAAFGLAPVGPFDAVQTRTEDPC